MFVCQPFVEVVILSLSLCMNFESACSSGELL